MMVILLYTSENPILNKWTTGMDAGEPFVLSILTEKRIFKQMFQEKFHLIQR